MYTSYYDQLLHNYPHARIASHTEPVPRAEGFEFTNMNDFVPSTDCWLAELLGHLTSEAEANAGASEQGLTSLMRVFSSLSSLSGALTGFESPRLISHSSQPSSRSPSAAASQLREFMPGIYMLYHFFLNFVVEMQSLTRGTSNTASGGGAASHIVAMSNSFVGLVREVAGQQCRSTAVTEVLEYFPLPLKSVVIVSLRLSRYTVSHESRWPLGLLEYINREDLVAMDQSLRSPGEIAIGGRRAKRHHTIQSMKTVSQDEDGLDALEKASERRFPEDDRVHEVKPTCLPLLHLTL